jgi:hypothetical protein
MALLNAILGPSAAGLNGCTCGASTSVAQLNQSAAISVMGAYQASLLNQTEGPGFLWTLPLSGGLPLTCPAPVTDPSVFDLYPTSKREWLTSALYQATLLADLSSECVHVCSTSSDPLPPYSSSFSHLHEVPWN